MATVFIPAQLRQLSGGVQSVEIEARNVREIVDQLDEMFPGFKDRICTGKYFAITSGLHRQYHDLQRHDC